MFETYPKQRPLLPPAYQSIYAQYYKKNREGLSTATGIAQKLEQWMHRKVAGDVAKSGAAQSTLEIGAGTLNHLPFEPNSRPYDIVEPFSSLYADSPNLSLVRKHYDDISEIPRDKKYDRIISIATFEHVCSLPEVIARCGLLLSDGGQLRVAIPSEGTPLWWLAWQTTTGLEFLLKYRLRYGVLMRHEHVNTAREIEEVLQFFFGNARRSSFGVSRALSLYQFFECNTPYRNRCTDMLDRL